MFTQHITLLLQHETKLRKEFLATHAFHVFFHDKFQSDSTRA